MASSGDHGPSDDKQPPVEHNLGPKSGSGPPDNEVKSLESVISDESEGPPSVDDTISTDDKVSR